jgi:hypothetical protein
MLCLNRSGILRDFVVSAPGAATLKVKPLRNRSSRKFEGRPIRVGPLTRTPPLIRKNPRQRLPRGQHHHPIWAMMLFPGLLALSA